MPCPPAPQPPPAPSLQEGGDRTRVGRWGDPGKGLFPPVPLPCMPHVLPTPGKGRGKLCHHVALSSPAVMKFMGDHPLRGQTELDAVCTILKVNPPPSPGR